MKKFTALLVVIFLVVLALLAAGCASNEKVVETIDPATGKVTKRVTTSETDTAQRAKAQKDYGKLLAKHGIFEMEAAEKTVTSFQYDDNGKVIGKTVTKTYEKITISGVKRLVVRTPMPKWQTVTEAWERALAKANGWLNMLMFGWLFGPRNYDSGTVNYELATTGNQSNINLGGKQAAMGSHVTNSGEGQASGGSMSYQDSSQQNQGDTRGFGDIGEIF